MRTLRAPLTALALAATLVLAGCGDDDPETIATPSVSPGEAGGESPSESAPQSPDGSGPATGSAAPGADALEVTIEGDTVSPVARAVEAEVGVPLVLEVSSDRPGELHAHSNPEQTEPLSQGRQTVEMTFDRPGQVDIEEHESGALILRVLVR